MAPRRPRNKEHHGVVYRSVDEPAIFSSWYTPLRITSDKRLTLYNREDDTFHRSVWCDRCERSFGHNKDKLNHLRDSSAHHICPRCSEDIASAEELKTHNENRHHYCANCEEFFESAGTLQDHNKFHHICSECDDYFLNNNNLRMVQYTPLDLTLRS